MEEIFNYVIVLLNIANEYMSMLEEKELIGDDPRTILMELIEEIEQAKDNK